MNNTANKFFQMGLEAFRAGKNCAPCQDSALMGSMKNGSVLEALKAWSAGWHHGNING